MTVAVEPPPLLAPEREATHLIPSRVRTPDGHSALCVPVRKNISDSPPLPHAFRTLGSKVIVEGMVGQLSHIRRELLDRLRRGAGCEIVITIPEFPQLFQESDTADTGNIFAPLWIELSAELVGDDSSRNLQQPLQV